MSSNIPTPEAIQVLVQSKEPGKVVMLNLLKFKPVTGVASYAEYARHVMPSIERVGAKIIFAGTVTSTVVGDQSWDSILLVEYPSRKVFIEMITSAEYQTIHHFRDEALERSELHAISPTGDFVPAIRP